MSSDFCNRLYGFTEYLHRWQPMTRWTWKFTSREVTAWGGLALLKRMLDGLDFKAALRDLKLPQPGSNRSYAPEQLIEPMIVSIGCAAARFAHADITRLDATLVRLFDWGKAARATKPSCGCFSALTKAVPRGCNRAATVGCLTN